MLFALLLPLFLGLGALAVDVGYWYVVKKRHRTRPTRRLSLRRASSRQGDAPWRRQHGDATTCRPTCPTRRRRASSSRTSRTMRRSGAGGRRDTGLHEGRGHGQRMRPGRSSAECSGSSRRRCRGERSRSGSKAAVSRSTRTSTGASERALVVLRGDNQQIRGHVHSDGTLRGPRARFVHDCRAHTGTRLHAGVHAVDRLGQFVRRAIRARPPARRHELARVLHGLGLRRTTAAPNPWPARSTSFSRTAPIIARASTAPTSSPSTRTTSHGQITVIARQITIKGDSNSFEPAPGGAPLLRSAEPISPGRPDGPVAGGDLSARTWGTSRSRGSGYVSARGSSSARAR